MRERLHHKPVAPGPLPAGVLCRRCEHLNLIVDEHCGRCGAELYILCPACSHRNQSVYDWCRKCDAKLRPRPVDRLLPSRPSRRPFRRFLRLILKPLGITLGALAMGTCST